MGKLEYFPLFFGYRKTFSGLTDEQFGIVIRAALAYADDGETIELDDPTTALALMVICGDIDRAQKKYDEKCEANRRSIEKRWSKNKPEDESEDESKDDTNVYERIRTNTDEYVRTNSLPVDTNVYERYQTKQNKTKQDNTIQNEESIAAYDAPTPAPAKKTKKKKEFVPPTVEEVAAYCKDKGLNTIDPEYFVRFYSESDWIKANGEPVRNWKSTVLTWAQRDKERGITAKPEPKPEPLSSFDLNDLSAAWAKVM